MLLLTDLEFLFASTGLFLLCLAVVYLILSIIEQWGKTK